MFVSPTNRRSPSTDTVGGAAAVDNFDDFPPDDRCVCTPLGSVVATAGDPPESLNCGGPISKVEGETRGWSLRVDGSTGAADGV